MNKVSITFISAGPTRSGDQVQARFRIVEHKPGYVANKSCVRSWTLTPEQLSMFMKAPGKATTAAVSYLMRTVQGVANPRDCATECQRALVAMHEAATGRAAQARARHQLAQAELAVRARVLRAMSLGVTEARIHEIVKECLVRDVMDV